MQPNNSDEADNKVDSQGDATVGRNLFDQMYDKISDLVRKQLVWNSDIVIYIFVSLLASSKLHGAGGYTQNI